MWCLTNTVMKMQGHFGCRQGAMTCRGSYDIIWWTGAGLGIVAAILHWPIDERAIPRTVPATAAGA